MPLLEVIQSRQIGAFVRFDENIATLVDQYAAFIHATADDVVNKALHYVFSMDREFQEYLKTSDARQVTSTLRVRRTSDHAEPKSRSATKTIPGAESIEPTTVGKP
jgi:hypothetical protein